MVSRRRVNSSRGLSAVALQEAIVPGELESDGHARTSHAALASPAAARRSRVLVPLHARVRMRPETWVSGRI